MKSFVLFILALSLMLPINHSVFASDDISVRLKVGSSEESKLLNYLYKNYPNDKIQLDNYRKDTSSLKYGTPVDFHFYPRPDGGSDINWTEVGAGVVGGLAATLAWNAFGGEVLCFLGFAPMCACVGPQC